MIKRKTKLQKYYAMWNVKEPGVYSRWDYASLQHLKAYRPYYKGFLSEIAAKNAFISNRPYDYMGKTAKFAHLCLLKDPYFTGEVNLKSMCADASYNSSMEYTTLRVVNTQTAMEVFRREIQLCPKHIRDFLAIYSAIEYYNEKGFIMPLYSTDRTAIKWIKQGCAPIPIDPFNEVIDSESLQYLKTANEWLATYQLQCEVLPWKTTKWGIIPADLYGKGKVFNIEPDVESDDPIWDEIILTPEEKRVKDEAKNREQDEWIKAVCEEMMLKNGS